MLTLSAIDQSRAERAASAWDQAGTAPDGSTEDITLFCRIDTLDEVDYFRHGGILHFVLRQLLEQAEPAGDAD